MDLMTSISFKKSSFAFYFVVLGINIIAVTATTKCSSWTPVGALLENITGTPVNCSFDDYCAGFTCSNKNVSAGIHIDLCTKPPSIRADANVPQLHIANWSHTFYSGERYKIPGAQLTLPAGQLDVFLDVNLTRMEEIVTVGIDIKGRVFMYGKELWPYSFPLVNNHNFRVPNCGQVFRTLPDSKVDGRTPVTKDKVNADISPRLSNRAETSQIVVAPASDPVKKCNISVVNSCGSNEICEQIKYGSSEGICKCVANHDDKGNCLPPATTTVPSSTSSSFKHSNDTIPVADIKNEKSSITVEVVVPLVVLFICSGLVYLAYRQRLLHRIRARILRVSAHEELLPEGDEDQISRPSIA